MSLLLLVVPHLIAGHLGLSLQDGAAVFFYIFPVAGLGLAIGTSIIAAFVLRAELQAAPIKLGLSSPMTFFCGPAYFQYFLDDLPAENVLPPGQASV